MPEAMKKHNFWRDALKQYNKGKECFHIPKKGTEAYKEVETIMNQLKNPTVGVMTRSKKRKQ